MGRPSKLDELRAKRIVDAIKAGASRTGAAKCARVHRATLMDWLARGRDGEQPYADFLDRVREAEGGVEERITTALLEAIEKGHVGAMCFWLERRRPDEWGKRDVVTHTHQGAEAGSDAQDLDVARSVVAALESRNTGTDGQA